MEQNHKTKILFDENTLTFVLEALGYEINSFGFVEYKSGQKVLDSTGKEFKAKDIVGIQGGVFFTNAFDFVDGNPVAVKEEELKTKIEEVNGMLDKLEKYSSHLKKHIDKIEFPESSNYSAHFPEMSEYVSEDLQSKTLIRYVYHSPMMNTWFISQSDDEKFADLMFKAECILTSKSIDKDERRFMVGSIVCDMDDNILEITKLLTIESEPKEIELMHFWTGFDHDYKVWLLYNEVREDNEHLVYKFLTCKRVDDSLESIERDHEPMDGSVIEYDNKKYQVICWERL